MAKDISFVCSNCGYDSKKWYGKCPECGEWNTFKEFKIPITSVRGKPVISSARSESQLIIPKKLSEINISDTKRLSTGFGEFDRVLGGVSSGKDVDQGIVPGSIILLSGDPGVGKSTVLLQVAFNVSNSGKKVLYVSGEESDGQIRLRAERVNTGKKFPDAFFLLADTNIDEISAVIQKDSYDLVILDSIQTVVSENLPGLPGSIAQVRFITSQLVQLGKTLQVPIILVGHVTKEGNVAGPMTLSHMVDTVLYLEGESISGTRILRCHKNRFGDTTEVGIFVMDEKGLVELSDASSFFIDKSTKKIPGACFTVILEGTRPLVLEIQALTVPTGLSFPRRTALGISDKKLEILLAILQKHARLPLDRLDVYVNVAGGMTIREPAVDLAVCLAIASSVKGKILKDVVACGEVGLLGEIKPVTNLEKRKKEAHKFGFKALLSFESAQELAILLQKVV